MIEKQKAKIVENRGRGQFSSNNPQVIRTRKHILQSTRELMVDKGFRAVSIDAVSVHSGASRSTIYRHWPSIDDLLFDAFATLVGEPFKAPNTGDFKRDLLLINQQYIDSVGDSQWMKILPSFLEISQNDEHCAELLALLVENKRSSSREILQRAQRDGLLSRRANIDWIVDVISGSLTYRALVSKTSLHEKGYLEFLIDAATSKFVIKQ